MRMEQNVIRCRQIVDEYKNLFQMRYALLIHPNKDGDCVYGIAIEKCEGEKVLEREEIYGFSEQEEEAFSFFTRVSDGEAMPVELMALADDYITEREWTY